MPFLKVAQNRCHVPIQLYYETHGQGPHKLLFINGMGSIASQWHHQAEYFLRQNEQNEIEEEKFEVCVFDNRGAGKSDSPDVYYS